MNNFQQSLCDRLRWILIEIFSKFDMVTIDSDMEYSLEIIIFEYKLAVSVCSFSWNIANYVSQLTLYHSAPLWFRMRWRRYSWCHKTLRSSKHWCEKYDKCDFDVIRSSFCYVLDPPRLLCVGKLSLIQAKRSFKGVMNSMKKVDMI